VDAGTQQRQRREGEELNLALCFHDGQSGVVARSCDLKSFSTFVFTAAFILLSGGPGV
jgi:hypothetical protein